jgi:uncharacterized membrane protein
MDLITIILFALAAFFWAVVAVYSFGFLVDLAVRAVRWMRVTIKRV